MSMGKKSASKQVLGRGLGELLGEVSEAYENEVPNDNNVHHLPIKEIKPNPFQPRKHFDEKTLSELSASIKEHGLIQPIVVVEDVDGYVLVAGERRLRASKLAKLKTIKAVIADITPEQMRQHALIENIQRDNLNPVELAYAYSELLKVHEVTHEELSRMIQKSRTHITNTLRLLSLSQSAQQALVEDKISAGHAKVLLGLDDKEQGLLVDSIIGQRLSVRDVERMAKTMKAPKKKEVLEKTEPKLSFSELKKILQDNGFNASSNSNKLQIEFRTQDDIDALLNFFA